MEELSKIVQDTDINLRTQPQEYSSLVRQIATSDLKVDATLATGKVLVYTDKGVAITVYLPDGITHAKLAEDVELDRDIANILRVL